jgi:hypothetical protein
MVEACCCIGFQNGPIRLHGLNGVTNEALLNIVLDRLRCFQTGEYACTENDEALRYAALSLQFLQRRTRMRIARIQ